MLQVLLISICVLILKVVYLKVGMDDPWKLLPDYKNAVMRIFHELLQFIAIP